MNITAIDAQFTRIIDLIRSQKQNCLRRNLDIIEKTEDMGDPSQAKRAVEGALLSSVLDTFNELPNFARLFMDAGENLDIKEVISYLDTLDERDKKHLFVLMVKCGYMQVKYADKDEAIMSEAEYDRQSFKQMKAYDALDTAIETYPI